MPPRKCFNADQGRRLLLKKIQFALPLAAGIAIQNASPVVRPSAERGVSAAKAATMTDIQTG